MALESVETFQAQALEPLAVADPRYESAYQTQAEANQAQARAAMAQSEVGAGLASAAAIRSGTDSRKGELERANLAKNEAGATAAAAAGAVATLTDKLPQLQAEKAAAEADADAATSGLQKVHPSDGQDKRAAALQWIQSSRKRQTEARQAVADAETGLKQANGMGHAEVDHQQTLELLAAEDVNQRAKDLTGIMRSGTVRGAAGSPGNGSPSDTATSGLRWAVTISQKVGSMTSLSGPAESSKRSGEWTRDSARRGCGRG